MEQLNGDDRENEMKQYVHDQYVDNIFQRVDHAVENRFELGHSLNGLQRSQHSQHAERLDGRQVRSDGTAAVMKTRNGHKNNTQPVAVITHLGSSSDKFRGETGEEFSLEINFHFRFNSNYYNYFFLNCLCVGTRF